MGKDEGGDIEEGIGGLLIVLRCLDAFSLPDSNAFGVDRLYILS